MRLYLVVQALGFPDVHLGISGAFFVALAASLLTAVPLTPAGIGFVEGGVVGLLTIVYGVSQTDALAITLVDRAISVLSIIVIGSIAYAISPKRRGLGAVSRARRPASAGLVAPTKFVGGRFGPPPGCDPRSATARPSDPHRDRPHRTARRQLGRQLPKGHVRTGDMDRIGCHRSSGP